MSELSIKEICFPQDTEQHHKCFRCGECCIDVGRTFWKCGDYKRWPVLEELANNGDYEDNELPCEMLRFEKNKAVCLVHKRYGYKAKPEVCQEHKGDKRCRKIKQEKFTDCLSRIS